MSAPRRRADPAPEAGPVPVPAPPRPGDPANGANPPAEPSAPPPDPLPSPFAGATAGPPAGRPPADAGSDPAVPPGPEGPRVAADGTSAVRGTPPPMPRRHVAVAALLGLGLGVLALGPALAPGFTLAYDMVFVPHPAFTRATFALTGMLPRQVPSDAVVTALSSIAPADVVQKAILLGIFVLACVSAARLVPSRRLAPRLVAGVVYAWNPFVAERLLLGQWALLLGYAALPAVAAAAARGGPRRTACALVPAAVGGFAAMAVSVPVALAVAACRWDGRRRTRVAWAAAILLAGCLPWLVPGLLRASAIPGDAAGVSAFAARADTPFGALGSLLLLGGCWNAEALPSGYGGLVTTVPWLCVVVLAVGAYAGGGRRVPGLGVAAVAGFALAALGVVAGGLLGAAVHAFPFLAVLRDGQQYVAPLAVVIAVGAGLAVERLVSAEPRPGPSTTPPGWIANRPGPAEGDREGHGGGRAEDGPGTAAPGGGRAARPGRAVYAVPVLLVPLALLPGLAWGAGGRLHAVRYPADWAAARAAVAADPGDVLVLPWEAYRSYPWNGGRRVLDPLPRYLPVPVILNDSVQVATRGGGTIRMVAEDPRVRVLDPLVRSGAPLAGAPATRGVRYVAIDVPGAPGADAWVARLAGAERVVTGPDIVLYRLRGGTVGASPGRTAGASPGRTDGARGR